MRNARAFFSQTPRGSTDAFDPSREHHPHSDAPSGPPRHRLTGGDLPRGAHNPSCGHAGLRSRGLQILAVFIPVLLSQLFGCLSPLPIPAAYAQTHEVTHKGERHDIQGYDAYGTLQGTYHEAECFIDEAKNTYWCVQPLQQFEEGSFTSSDIYDHFSKGTVHKMALAEYWCKHNTDKNTAGYLTQVFVWKILKNDGQLNYMHTVNWVLTGFDSDKAWTEFEVWYAKNKDDFTSGGSYWQNGSSQDIIHLWVEEDSGDARVVKVSTEPDITDDNPCYSLAGATYSIYRDELCTTKLGSKYDLVTGKDGVSNTVSLDPGTYWVKETKAPMGFKLNDTVYRMVVSRDETATVNAKDAPVTDGPDVWVNKHDAQITDNPQGDAALEGAEYTVRYYAGSYTTTTLPSHATRTWVLRCDAHGSIKPTEASKVSGPDFYRSKSGAVVFPLGTVTVQETKAPAGYWLEGQGPNSPAGYKAPVHLVNITKSGSYGTVVSDEDVHRGGLSLTKVDAERDGGQAQGDATLQGAKFAIILDSANPVVVKGTTYTKGQTVMTIETDAKGFATTGPRDLPYGTYLVRESAPSTGYLLNTDFQARVTVHADGVVQKVSPATCAETVVRGGVRVGKVSRETGKHLSQGEADVAGAVIHVSLVSDQPVVVDGTPYQKGDVVCELTTDESGVAATDDHALPYGTYALKEVEAPEGFLPNENWAPTFEIRTDGQVHDYGMEATSVDDQVVRGGFYLNKVNEQSMERMGNVAFLIRSNTTGEQHLVVTDENGMLSTERVPHTKGTNANDAALLEDGTVDEQRLDPEAGVWFHGRTDVTTEPDDRLCALPYDTYTVEELPGSANEGTDPVSFTIRIHRHDQTLDMGTVDDKQQPVPSIGTTLTYAGDQHVAPAQAEAVLVDTVSYTGLKPGTEYTVEGTLMKRETGEALPGADGAAITAQRSFTPTTADGTVDLEFVVDTSKLGGASLVAFESLKLGGSVVASHEDLEDEGQTVHVPSLGTTLARQDGDDPHTIVLTDLVDYRNLVPNRSYEVVGTLMDKDTAQPLKTPSGDDIRKSVAFVPTEADGTVEVAFELTGEVAAGHTLVAFESLLRGGITYAEHADLKDEGQTVDIPQIRTTLTGNEGEHTVAASGTVELTDTVRYTKLTPGKTYTLTGTLMDKATGEPLTDGDGNPLQATTELTPTEADDTATVTFTCDASLLAGKTVVAFETLMHEGREVAVHADIDDEDQTVYVPKVGTMLVDNRSEHETAATEKLTLTDTVRYEGLPVGQQVTVEGILMDAKTGKPVTVSKKKVEASALFTTASGTGTCEVSFVVDAQSLAGTTVVAFEKLYLGEGDGRQLVASHEDLSSTDQTVSFPQIATKAHDKKDNDKTVAEGRKACIVDEVSYRNLTPGATYVMRATLYDKATGRALVTAKGDQVQSQTEFVPKKSSGTVNVTLEFDTDLVSGTEVVAFESCRRDDREVAVHADIHDKDQTVTIDRPKKPEEKTPGTREKTPKTGDRMRSVGTIVAAGVILVAVALLVRRRTA